MKNPPHKIREPSVRGFFGSVLWAVLLATGAAVAVEKEASHRPNIIVILTDDQGYADLGVQGRLQDVRTPNVDALAGRGARFTSGYVTAPVCGPSRAGLLSGQYQERFGVYDNEDLPFRYSGTPLPERLRAFGYRTGMVGKLHLPINGDKGEDPRLWGFDEYFMKHGQFQISPNKYLTAYPPNGGVLPEARWMEAEGYRTEVHTQAALQFIDRNKDRPFFLYVAYFAPHTPLEAPSKYLERFPDATPDARRHALAMLSAIDDGVGRIMEKLREIGADEKTLIFFVSDNGAPQKCADRTLPVVRLGLEEWNGSENTPLRGEKTMLAEGGIRVPFVVSWPGVIPPGQVIETPVSTLDIAATVLTLTGSDTRDLDGVDLLPLLTGVAKDLPRDALFWGFGGQTAVRRGKWKLLSTRTSGDFLFSLDDDPLEETNRLREFPGIASGLKDELKNWQDSLGERKPVRQLQLKLEKKLFHNHFGVLEEGQN